MENEFLERRWYSGIVSLHGSIDEGDEDNELRQRHGSSEDDWRDALLAQVPLSMDATKGGAMPDLEVIIPLLLMLVQSKTGLTLTSKVVM